MDRLDEWRVFLTVARRGSFARAAEQHQCSPQAVTRAVAALEARVGARLLHRTTRSVSLTDEGARRLALAERLVQEADALESPPDARAPLRGTLSITAPVLYGQLHVMPVVTRFIAKHPHLDVRLLLVDRVVSLVDEGIDLAVRIGALPDSSLRAQRIGSVRTVLCASPAYLARHGVPRSAKSLAKHACIAFAALSPIADRWTFTPSGESGVRRVSVRPRLAVNTGQAAIDAALAGVGIVRVLSYQVDALASVGKLRIVLESLEPEPAPIHLVWMPSPSRAVDAFRAEMSRAS